jgi:undecaprenyl-diphosphatase
VDLERLTASVLDPGVPPLVIYTLLFFGCALESFFPPWPADAVALYSGILAGRGVLHPTTVLAVAVGGTQVGVMTAFWAARRWGRAVLEGPLGRHLPTARLLQLERWFLAYGAPAIAVSRFFPGVRALVTPAAGLARFSAWKVWVYAGVSVVIWNIFVVGVGMLAGVNLEWGRQVLTRYNAVAVAALAVAVAGLGALLLYRRLARREITPR